ncbi:MAG: cytochrome c oxidase accessory protein CcoG [Bacteroidia bacterium]
MNDAPQIDEHVESFRDTIATIDKEGKRAWIFPNKPKGKYYNYRSYVTVIYLVVFFGLPFIKIHGEPLFLFNIVERKFILFGMIFWPQDFFIFGLGMLIFIVFVALFTVIYGRVFCGWACPQTIFMEMLFRKIEYWIDGDANYQKALRKSPWNTKKIIKRVSKLTLFFLLSFTISSTLLSYIIGVDHVLKIITEPLSQHKGAFVSLIAFTAVFFFIYSWFREQVCLIVCPYGRMQGVLLDKNSIVVAYDYVRGEPREKFKKGETRKSDCIDCGLCVKVCPTGIDIRNGTQLECINCTACIDACDNIMEGVNLPKGLIRYDSENGIKNKTKLKFTGRMKAYTAVLMLLIGVEVFLLATRSDYDATILRAKGMLFQEQPNNQISNLYTIKLVNKTRDSFPVLLKVENMQGDIKVIGKDIVVNRESMVQGEFFVFLDKVNISKRKTPLQIGLYSNNKRIKIIKTNFLGPVTINVN